MRRYRNAIETAKLILLPPPNVCEWLAKRAENIESSRWSSDEGIDKVLLARDDPLINLGLAQYTISDEVACELFARLPGADASQRQHNLALRLGVLSNQSLSSGALSFGLVRSVFGKDKVACLNWLNTADTSEIWALFENPTLGDDFLCDFLEGKESWGNVVDDKRPIAIAALAGNERMKAQYEGPMDGWAEFRHGKVFDAAWGLARSAPLTRDWADVLSMLFGACRPISLDSPADALLRWHRPSEDDKAAEEKARNNKMGHLGSFQSVRMNLSRLASRHDRKAALAALQNGDVAVRCAAYMSAALSAEQIAAAFERDRLFAVNHALLNEELWRSEETREALRKISWQAVKDDKHSDLLHANDYEGQREHILSKHPDWFSDEEQERPEAGDDPATKSDLIAVAEKISAGLSSLANIPTTIDSLRPVLTAMVGKLGWIFWFSLGALVVGIGRHL
jgi:hypothetical protein